MTDDRYEKSLYNRSFLGRCRCHRVNMMKLIPIQCLTNVMEYTIAGTGMNDREGESADRLYVATKASQPPMALGSKIVVSLMKV